MPLLGGESGFLRKLSGYDSQGLPKDPGRISREEEKRPAPRPCQDRQKSAKAIKRSAPHSFRPLSGIIPAGLKSQPRNLIILGRDDTEHMGESTPILAVLYLNDFPLLGFAIAGNYRCGHSPSLFSRLPFDQAKRTGNFQDS